MFQIIFLLGLAYVFIGGILGKKYHYSILTVGIYLFTSMFNINSSCYGLGFMAVIIFVIVTAIMTVLFYGFINVIDLIRN